MAEITGPFRFKGSVGNFRCYYNSAAKKWVVSTKGGPTKEALENSPNFARSRENMSEFKACGKWSSLIRKALFEIDHLNYGYYMAGIVQLAKSLQVMDALGKRGHRNIEPSKFKPLLADIVFNELHPFKQVLARQPEVIADPQRQTITLNIAQFRPKYELRWPQRQSWFRFTLAIAQLSDFTYVEEDGGYGPAHFGLNANKATFVSEWMMQGTEAVDISMTASFADDAIAPEDATVLVALGIEFGNKMSGNTFSSGPKDGTMALVACL